MGNTRLHFHSSAQISRSYRGICRNYMKRGRPKYGGCLFDISCDNVHLVLQMIMSNACGPYRRFLPESQGRYNAPFILRFQQNRKYSSSAAQIQRRLFFFTVAKEDRSMASMPKQKRPGLCIISSFLIIRSSRRSLGLNYSSSSFDAPFFSSSAFVCANSSLDNFHILLALWLESKFAGFILTDLFFHHYLGLR